MIARDENGIHYGPVHAFGLSTDEVMQFYKSNWQRRIALELPHFYRWQFLDPPMSGELDWNCVGVRGSEILGIMGLNPRPFRLNGKERRAAELTTWVVGEAARGLGIGRGIMRSIQSAYELTFGFGISDTALPIYMMQNYRRLRHIPRYFRIFNIEVVRSHARIDRLGERLAGQWSKVSGLAVQGRKVPAEGLGEFARSMVTAHNLYERDAPHLAWRYDRHPTFRYEAFEISTEGSERAVGLVIRADSIGELRFLHVLDILGDHRDVPLALVYLDKIARQRGCGFADFYCTATSMTRHLLAGGWFSTSDDTCLQLSHLFYPPEFRETQTTSMVYWSRSDMAELADLGRLYLTKQDLDLDRPTLSFYETHHLPQE